MAWLPCVTAQQPASAAAFTAESACAWTQERLPSRFASSQPASIWTYPVETVSQSEGGFELVHQSVAVLPHWIVVPDAEGRWSMTMRLSVDTHLAESRMPQFADAAAY